MKTKQVLVTEGSHEDFTIVGIFSVSLACDVKAVLAKAIEKRKVANDEWADSLDCDTVLPYPENDLESYLPKSWEKVEIETHYLP